MTLRFLRSSRSSALATRPLVAQALLLLLALAQLRLALVLLAPLAPPALPVPLVLLAPPALPVLLALLACKHFFCLAADVSWRISARRSRFNALIVVGSNGDWSQG